MTDIDDSRDEAGPSKQGVNYKILYGGLGALVCVMGGMLYWRYTKAHKNEVGGSAEERAVAARGAGEAEKARQAGEGIKQPAAGQDLQFDAQGNLLGPAVSDQGLPTNKTADAMRENVRKPVAESAEGDAINQAAFGSQVPITAGGIPQYRNADSSVIEATARVSRDELADLRRPSLAYSTVVRPDGKETSGTVVSTPQHVGTVPASLPEKASPSYDSMAALDEVAKTALRMQASQGINPAPGGSIVPGEAVYHSVRSQQGTVCDMRFQKGGPFYRIMEGEFLDCVLVNRAVIDREDVPVKALVRRDFLSPDGRYVLIPSGTTVLLVGGRVQYQEQSRIFIRAHRQIFPNGLGVYFPERQLPEGMDLMGGLGVPGKVNHHWMLQFLAAVGVGVVEGYAAFEAGPVTSSPLGGSVLTPKQSAVNAASQNFNEVAKRWMDKYANVPPTITLPNGKPIKVYYSSDTFVSPYRSVQSTAWYRSQAGVRP